MSIVFLMKIKREFLCWNGRIWLMKFVQMIWFLISKKNISMIRGGNREGVGLHQTPASGILLRYSRLFYYREIWSDSVLRWSKKYIWWMQVEKCMLTCPVIYSTVFSTVLANKNLRKAHKNIISFVLMKRKEKTMFWSPN